MRILTGLLLVMLINSSVWAYFILRASDPNGTDAENLASQIQRVLQSPARVTSVAEVNTILKDLGAYTLRENSGPLEFGFAAGSVRKKLIQGPEVLHYVRVGADKEVTLATLHVGGFSWKLWHMAQTLRAGYPLLRRHTFKDPRGAWLELGVKVQGGELSYADSQTTPQDLLYCFPNCMRAEGPNPKTAQQTILAIPFLFGPRQEIAYSSGILSHTN